MKPVLAAIIPAVLLLAAAAPAQTPRCDIPREARDIWRCRDGFVIGPENVIIRLPIPETDPAALYQAGLAAAQRENWRVAIAYFTAAHQRAHLDPAYMYNLGLAHARAGNEIPAIGWLVAFLIAEPGTPNRAAIWTQILQLEGEATRRANLLWERAPQVVSSFPQGMERLEAANALAEAAADAGDVERMQSFAGMGADTSRQGLLLRAYSAAQADYDAASMERILPLIPTLTREGLNRGVAELRAGAVRLELATEWPLRLAGLTLSLDDMQSGASMQSDTFNRPADRVPALAALGRTQEVFATLGRLQAGDWSREHLDQSLRSNDEYLRSQGEAYVRPDRGQDSLFRFRQGEMAAAHAGEVFLRLGDVPNATRAAEIARAIVAQGERASRQIDQDLSFWGRSPNAASLLGWNSIHADALLVAQRGEVDAAVRMLDLFIARRARTISRPTLGPSEQTPDERTLAFEPGIAWEEARHLGAFAVATFLVRIGRIDEALQLSARLDSLRRQQVHALIRSLAPAGAARVPAAQPASPALLRAIVSARTLNGAARDSPAWLRRIEGTHLPNEQARLFGFGASDIQRGLRRTRGIFTINGGTWGQ